MAALFRTRFGWLRLIAFSEGVSFLILLGVAMPLKYLAGKPGMVHSVGMIHGILFVAFLACMALAKDERDWPVGTTALVFLSSLLPFGTLWAEFRIFRRRPISE